MSDDQQKAAAELAGRIARMTPGMELGEEDVALAKSALPEPELEPGVYTCWRRGSNGMSHGAILCVAENGDKSLVDREDGSTWCSAEDHFPRVSEIRPLVPQDDKPPAPRGLLKRAERLLRWALQLVPKGADHRDMKELLAEVYRHSDPELPTTLRELAIEAADAHWNEQRVSLERKLNKLAEELEGRS